MRRPVFIAYDDFELEILKSGYHRAGLMIVALLVMFVISFLNLFFLEHILAGYISLDTYLFIMGWLALLIVFEIAVLVRIRWFHRQGLRLPAIFKRVYAFIEVTFPSVLMFYLVDVKGYALFLDSPLFAFYFLIIILSTLHLDFYLSLFIAVAGTLQYAYIIYHGFHVVTLPGLVNGPPELSYYLRCVMLLISGVAAGFVAAQIKTRLRSYLDEHKSKSEITAAFGQQVSQEIVNALSGQGNAARQFEATVLAFDIRNFSAFAEKHSPDEILAFQNKVFAPILDIIRSHKGIVNQILGDGIMATFGAPVSNPEHAHLALEASLKIRYTIKALTHNGTLPDIRIGIGLHTGEVITGNIGNDHRKQYSVIGTPVIIAFRVEQLNKELGTDLLVTEDLKNKTVAAGASFTYRGTRALKGLGSPMNIYSVD
jgi:adenylate cyclase